jgi:hypothetical protein
VIDPDSAQLRDRSLEILTAAGCRTTSAISSQTSLVLLFLSSPVPRDPVVENFGPPNGLSKFDVACCTGYQAVSRYGPL